MKEFNNSANFHWLRSCNLQNISNFDFLPNKLGKVPSLRIYVSVTSVPKRYKINITSFLKPAIRVETIGE